MKLVQLIDSKEALQRLIGKEIPIRTAFKLQKFIKSANQELEIFEEQRIKLIHKYGFKNVDGNMVIPPNNVGKFQQEIDELMSMEINITIEKISLVSLGEIDISVQDLLILDYLIIEE